MLDIDQTQLRRLTVCAALVIGALVLSAIAFYYFHVTAPVIPLLVGLLAALPLGMIIDDLRRLLKVKKSQQSHHPPNRSQ